MKYKRRKRQADTVSGGSKTHIVHPKTGKKVALKKHHAKSYRKRHYGVLLIALALCAVAFVSAVRYRAQVNKALDTVASLVANTNEQNALPEHVVTSNYGFSVRVSPERYSVSAVEHGSGTIFNGEDTAVARTYSPVQVLPAGGISRGNFTSLSVTVSDKRTPDASQDAIEKQFAPSNVPLVTATKQSTEEATISGQQFRRTVWQVSSTAKSLKDSKPVITVMYTGLLADRPIGIKITGASYDATEQYREVLDAITFGSPDDSVSQKTPQPANAERASRQSPLEKVFVGRASAAVPNVSASERVSAQYSPAVIKIYNFRCGIPAYKDTEVASKQICVFGTGSGFLIGSDGYIGTNGHVAVISAKDIIAEASFYSVSAAELLIKISGVTEAELQAQVRSGKTDQEIGVFIYQKFYALPDEDFSFKKDTHNLMVTIGADQPDALELAKATEAGTKVDETDTLRRAEIVASDYAGTIDLISGKFSASDVALMKITGSNNFPITKLGSLTGLNSGGGLNILGYPGNANQGALVDDSKTAVTLTTGKVSAIKDDSSGQRKIIETDTTIGNGNSGGPAFNDQGEVVGLATYTITDNAQAKGTFNYVRDIEDLKKVVGGQSITLNTASETQAEWDEGINFFFNARYSKALKNFERVKELYPVHAKADEFANIANEKIKNGEDIKDFPIILVAAGGIGLIGVLVAVVIIIRHRKKHALYQQHIAPGQQPPSTGLFPQNPPANPGAAQTPSQPAPPVANTQAPNQFAGSGTNTASDANVPDMFAPLDAPAPAQQVVTAPLPPQPPAQPLASVPAPQPPVAPVQPIADISAPSPPPSPQPVTTQSENGIEVQLH